RTRIDAGLDKTYPQLEALYKDIHQHPELGFQENRTAALLAARMRKLGFTVTDHVGKTGIVAIYKNGPGKTILIRTELMHCRWRKRPACPTPAVRNRRSTAGSPMWTTVVAMTSIWPGGSARPRRCWP